MVSTRARRAAPLGALFILVTLLSSCGRPAESPPPDVSTPAGYQGLLAGTDRDLADALAGIGRASALDGLDRSVLSAAGVASAISERLTNSGPVPPTVAADNTALADGLRRLGRELGYLSQQINQRAICTGPAAVSAISTAPSMPGLRAVAAGLASPTAERPAYRWGAALPPEAEVVEARLPNGTLVTDRRPPDARGDGVLEARNEGSLDAVLTLARGGSTLVALAVSAGAAARVDGVPDGDYELYYTTGRGWDTGLGVFSRHCEFHRFTAAASLHSRPAPGGGTAYTVQTVTVRDRPAAATDTSAMSAPDATSEVPQTALPR